MSHFAELVACTNFSFLRGASHPHEMVEQAAELKLAAIGVGLLINFNVDVLRRGIRRFVF